MCIPQICPGPHPNPSIVAAAICAVQVLPHNPVPAAGLHFPDSVHLLIPDLPPQILSFPIGFRALSLDGNSQASCTGALSVQQKQVLARFQLPARRIFKCAVDWIYGRLDPEHISILRPK